MNISNVLNNLEINAVDAVHDFVARVPNIEVSLVDRELTLGPDYRIDARIGFSHGEASYALIVEAKKNGAPRFVRSAIHHLKSYLTHMHQSVHEHVGPRLIPMIVSPYLSPESRSICTNHNVAYLDLVGKRASLFRERVYRTNRRREAEI